MEKFKNILANKRGSSFPLIIAVTLALAIIFCGVSEYFRLMVIAQGVRDAVQSAVISTVNDNYSDVYHGIREGYSGAYQPTAWSLRNRWIMGYLQPPGQSLWLSSRGYHENATPISAGIQNMGSDGGYSKSPLALVTSVGSV